MVQSLDRTFDILELLAGAQGGVSLTEISQRLELHKSTVYRLLAALRKRGYIEQSEKRAPTASGSEFLHLCGQYLNSLELKTEAEPHLRRLSQVTGQTVFLAIHQGGEVVYIDKVEQFNSLRKYSVIGQRRPLHCTSLGKALLLGLSEAEIAGYCAGRDLRGRSPRDHHRPRTRCRRTCGSAAGAVTTTTRNTPSATMRRRADLRLPGEGDRGGQRVLADEGPAAGPGGGEAACVMEAAWQISRRMGSRAAPPRAAPG